MAERKRRAAVSWATCKAAMKHWPHPGVVELVHELYALSEENRTFLHARLVAEKGAVAAADAAKKRLLRLLSESTVFNGRFRHIDCKRVVDTFDKATDDKAAVAGLLVADLANSLAVYMRVGDFEPIVGHVYASMNRLDGILQTLPPAAARAVLDELVPIEREYRDRFGYGLSDELTGLVTEWRERLGPSGPARPAAE